MDPPAAGQLEVEGTAPNVVDIARVRTRWENFPGAPGVTTMYMEPTGMQAKVDFLRVFWEAIKVDLPSATTLTIEPAGDVISDLTGAITGGWSVTTPPAPTTATGVGVFAGPAGIVVHWLTGAVRDGRRVRGRTFVVPAIGSDYDSGGTITAAALTRIGTAAATLITNLAGSLLVWHRPVDDAVPPHVNHPGSAVTVSAALVPDKVIILRTRRT